MSENKITLAKKLQELAKRGSDGEREAAQAALNKVLRKYDITLTDLDDEQENDYRFNYHGDEELKILSQIAYKVIGERGHVHPLVYTASNRRCRKAVDISCTEAQRIERGFPRRKRYFIFRVRTPWQRIYAVLPQLQQNCKRCHPRTLAKDPGLGRLTCC